MFVAYLGCMGMVLGSFLACLLSRDLKFTDMSGRSHCDSCGKVLAWYELIPFFSYLFQRGTCRVCKAKVPVWYFFAEIMGGLTLVGAYLMDWKFSIILVLLYVCALYDFKFSEVPYWLTNGTLAYASIAAFLSSGVSAVLAGICVFIAFFLIYQLDPNLIGGSDVKLLAASLMFYSFMDIPFYLLMVATFGLITLTFRKDKTGLQLIPILWIVYILQYLVTL